MSQLQPEDAAWGACYLALLGAEQVGERTAAQALLASGTPGRTLNALYPLDGFIFTAHLAACSPTGSVSLDRLEALAYCHGGFFGDQQVSAVYQRLSGERSLMKAWLPGWKAALETLPLATPYGGRRSSLHLIWQLLQILPRWAELTWLERGEFYRICLELDEVLAACVAESTASPAALWLSGTA